jgi:hypothetical protein
MYLAHRLAWFYMKGEWPPVTVDHEDLDKSNNRWLNLRLATSAEQSHNTPVRRKGLKGVWLDKRVGRWSAEICHQGKRTYLGMFDTEEVAHAAYRKAAAGLFGNFVRYN